MTPRIEQILNIETTQLEKNLSNVADKSVMETFFCHLQVSGRDVWGHVTSSLQVEMRNISYLLVPHCGASQDEIGAALRLRGFPPFHGSACKLQLYFVENVEIQFGFCKMLLMTD